MKLTGSDNKLLFDTLATAFKAPALRQLVETSVPEVSGELPEGVSIRELVAELVQIANHHGVLDRLLVAAASERPGRPDVRGLVLALSQRPGWTTRYGRNDLSVEGLERLTSKGVPFLDVSRLARWMIAVENQVCQVRCGDAQGTGFLVAPDLVMTNYHVVKGHLDGGTPSTSVQVRFDHRVGPGGEAPDDAAPYLPVDPAWKIPFRPFSAADISLVGLPSPTELDYAILKLAEPAGDEQITGRGTRGWVDVSTDVPLPAVDAPILIVQHPGQPPEGSAPQQPLKIAFSTPGFEEANENGTRVSYRPSTLKGSSGSPVFGPDYRAVALHHNRGQNSGAADGLDKNNRGIPLSAIRADLRGRGDLQVDVLAMFVAPPPIA